MGKMMKVGKTILLGVCVLVIAYFALRAFGSFKQGYTWKEMNWHQHGSTSISDFFEASDIGKREVTESGKKCVQYFAYKDGLPVKTVCPE